MRWLIALIFLINSFSLFELKAEDINIAKEDFKLGMYIAAQVQKQYKVIDDHPDIERVMNIASRIIDAAGSGTFYSFQIVEAPVANAFALPGGFVFITDKLLEQNLSDGELAFLIGHEISHVQNRHFERIQKERAKVSFMNALTTIGAILLASQTNRGSDRDRLIRQGAATRAGPPDINRPTQTQLPPHLVPILAGNIFGTLYLLHSQRDFEYEADISGARIALRAGYTIEEGIGMLKKLFYTNYRNASMEQWTTHPLTQARMLALKSKVDPKWMRPAQSEAYIKQYRKEKASLLLKIYNEVDNWKSVRGLPKKKETWNRVKRILLKRAVLWSPDKETERRTVELELKDHIRPRVEKQPFLLADYGEYLNKCLELKKLGGEPEEDLEEIREKSQICLQTHRNKIKKSTPGYQQLKYLVGNYPNEPEADSWTWDMWLKETDVEEKLFMAKQLWEKNTYQERMREELEKVQLFHKDNPWVYRRVCYIIDKAIDVEALEETIKECEDLKVLLRYQHEFPNDEHLDKVNLRRAKLLSLRFRAGRLAALSGQSRKAVLAYNDVLLYDAGSELEEEARNEIFRLNTLSGQP